MKMEPRNYVNFKLCNMEELKGFAHLTEFAHYQRIRWLDVMPCLVGWGSRDAADERVAGGQGYQGSRITPGERQTDLFDASMQRMNLDKPFLGFGETIWTIHRATIELVATVAASDNLQLLIATRLRGLGSHLSSGSITCTHGQRIRSCQKG